MLKCSLFYYLNRRDTEIMRIRGMNSLLRFFETQKKIIISDVYCKTYPKTYKNHFPANRDPDNNSSYILSLQG